jgi:predicted TIM-barrel fold metal-dependent hydrolase
MVPGPVPNDEGYVSPGHPKFDPVWSLLNDAGIPLALHAGLSGVSAYGRFWGTGAPAAAAGFEGFKHATFPMVAFQDRAISDTFAALLCHGVLDRFPNLRLASIENGAMWVPDLLRNLKDGYGKMPFTFEADPVERFREQVYVAPYYEDDMDVLRDVLGIDRLLFGSDFPHAEGLPEPTMYVKDIPTYDEDETRKVMRENVLELITPRPT